MNALAPTLQVKVISPFEVIYAGAAEALSAKNALGPFDVLPGHVSFMTLIVAGEVVVHTGTDKRRYTLRHGILKVHKDQVVLFANI